MAPFFSASARCTSSDSARRTSCGHEGGGGRRRRLEALSLALFRRIQGGIVWFAELLLALLVPLLFAAAATEHRGRQKLFCSTAFTKDHSNTAKESRQGVRVHSLTFFHIWTCSNSRERCKEAPKGTRKLALKCTLFPLKMRSFSRRMWARTSLSDAW